jgi:hypothetical protein
MRPTTARTAAGITAALLVLIVTPGAAFAQQSTASRVVTDQRPDHYVLEGDNVYPEGIAKAPGHTFFVGSLGTGAVYRGDTRTSRTEIFLAAGRDGRTTAIGMKVDNHGHLIIAGGPTGYVWVYDTATGALLNRFTTGSTANELNDLTVAPNGDIYITDSFRPTLWRVPAAQLGRPVGHDLPLEPWLDLHGNVAYDDGFNANGIVATPDGQHLLFSDFNSAVIYRVDLSSRAITRLPLSEPVTGDGLLLDGSTLYAVDSLDAPGNAIVRIALRPDLTAGQVVSRTTNDRLHFPSTIAADGDDLLAVNFQFDKLSSGQAPQLPFDVVRVPKP